MQRPLPDACPLPAASAASLRNLTNGFVLLPVSHLHCKWLHDRCGSSEQNRRPKLIEYTRTLSLSLSRFFLSRTVVD